MNTISLQKSDDLWSPFLAYDLFEFLQSPSDIQKQEVIRDLTKRKFNVMFHIEDPLNRTKEINFIISEAHRLEINGYSSDIRLYIPPNNKGKFDCVAFEVYEQNFISAFRLCYEIFMPILSYWSFKYGAGLSEYAVFVRDEKYMVDLKSSPQLGSQFTTPKALDTQNDLDQLFKLDFHHQRMLSLYREGRNSISPFYKFLCHYKILEAALAQSIFKETDKSIKIIGVDKREKGRITDKILKQARAEHSHYEFKNVSFGDYRQAIESERNRIAHGLINSESFDFDDINEIVEIGILSNITDLVARKILSEELRLQEIIRQNSKKE